jgi:hypothetical protein
MKMWDFERFFFVKMSNIFFCLLKKQKKSLRENQMLTLKFNHMLYI